MNSFFMNSICMNLNGFCCCLLLMIMNLMVDMKIFVLRLGHRKERDKRVSTHCGLVARAFGADGIVYTGEKDLQMESSLKKVVRQWGGPFFVKYDKNWKQFFKKFRGTKIHLTMYGMPIQNKIEEIRRKAAGKKLLIVIGSEKVPGEIYDMAGYNIAITSQPHSEIAALALFLHEFSVKKEKKFAKANIRILPQETGKKVIKV